MTTRRVILRDKSELILYSSFAFSFALLFSTSRRCVEPDDLPRVELDVEHSGATKTWLLVELFGIESPYLFFLQRDEPKILSDAMNGLQSFPDQAIINERTID